MAQVTQRRVRRRVRVWQWSWQRAISGREGSILLARPCPHDFRETRCYATTMAVRAKSSFHQSLARRRLARHSCLTSSSRNTWAFAPALWLRVGTGQDAHLPPGRTGARLRGTCAALLFVPPPKQVYVAGLGVGSLPRWALANWGDSLKRLDIVELRDDVISLTHSAFPLPPGR